MNPEAIPRLEAFLCELRMLVVDSNTTLRTVLREVLESAGARTVLGAEDISEAWKIWQDGRDLGLVVSRWRFEDGAPDGETLLARIREDQNAFKQPSFLFILNPKQALSADIATLADGHLRRPFSAVRFAHTVRETLNRQLSSADQQQRAQQMETHLLNAYPEVELLLDHYASKGECESLDGEKCVVRTNKSYGLGSLIQLRFAKTGSPEELTDGSSADGEDNFFKPVRVLVQKIEHVPKKSSTYRNNTVCTAFTSAFEALSTPPPGFPNCCAASLCPHGISRPEPLAWPKIILLGSSPLEILRLDSARREVARQGVVLPKSFRQCSCSTATSATRCSNKDAPSSMPC